MSGWLIALCIAVGIVIIVVFIVISVYKKYIDNLERREELYIKQNGPFE
jgi:Tfp pilus assembly protein PilE